MMKRLFAFLLTVAVLLAAGMVQAETTEGITITFSDVPTAIPHGGTVTLKYTITGGSGSYTEITPVWVNVSAGGEISTDGDKLSAASGTVSFTPAYVGGVYLSLTVEDSAGGYEFQDSPLISVDGVDEVPELTINLSAMCYPEWCVAGYPLSFHGRASGGSGSGYGVFTGYRWGNADGYTTIQCGDFGRSFSLSFTPEAHWDWVQPVFTVYDSANRERGIWGDRIAVKDEIESPLAISVTCPERILAGEVTTFGYEVTGGTGVYEITAYGSGGRQEGPLTEASGQLSWTPKNVDSVTVGFIVSDGRESLRLNTVPIPVEGEMEPGTLMLELGELPASVAAGETFSLSYQASGGTGDYEVTISWYAVSGGGSIWLDNVYPPLTEASGTVSFTPTTGEGIYAKVGLYDVGTGYADQRSATTKVVAVTGTPVTEPLKVVASAPEWVRQGDTFTAYYTVTGGSGEYDWIDVSVIFSDGQVEYVLDSRSLSQAAGSLQLRAAMAGDVYLHFELFDSEMRSYQQKVHVTKALASGEPAPSVIPGEWDVTLPSSLLEIGAEAFENTGAVSVWVPDGASGIRARAFSSCARLSWVRIPASVTSIDPTAFSGCAGLTLVVESGSAAEAYAAQYGIPYVTE